MIAKSFSKNCRPQPAGVLVYPGGDTAEITTCECSLVRIQRAVKAYFTPGEARRLLRLFNKRYAGFVAWRASREAKYGNQNCCLDPVGIPVASPRSNTVGD